MAPRLAVPVRFPAPRSGQPQSLNQLYTITEQKQAMWTDLRRRPNVSRKCPVLSHDPGRFRGNARFTSRPPKGRSH